MLQGRGSMPSRSAKAPPSESVVTRERSSSFALLGLSGYKPSFGGRRRCGWAGSSDWDRALRAAAGPPGQRLLPPVKIREGASRERLQLAECTSSLEQRGEATQTFARGSGASFARGSGASALAIIESGSEALTSLNRWSLDEPVHRPRRGGTRRRRSETAAAAAQAFGCRRSPDGVRRHPVLQLRALLAGRHRQRSHAGACDGRCCRRRRLLNGRQPRSCACDRGARASGDRRGPRTQPRARRDVQRRSPARDRRVCGPPRCR